MVQRTNIWPTTARQRAPALIPALPHPTVQDRQALALHYTEDATVEQQNAARGYPPAASFARGESRDQSSGLTVTVLYTPFTPSVSRAIATARFASSFE